MSHYTKKQMIMSVLTWVLWVIMLVGIVIGVDKAHAAEMCLSTEDAGKAIVEIEQSRQYPELITQMDERIALILEKNKIQAEIISLKDQQIEVLKQGNKDLQGLLVQQKEAYESIIKASQPTFWDKLGLIGIGGILGVIIGVVAGAL